MRKKSNNRTRKKSSFDTRDRNTQKIIDDMDDDTRLSLRNHALLISAGLLFEILRDETVAENFFDQEENLMALGHAGREICEFVVRKKFCKRQIKKRNLYPTLKTH